MAALPLLAVTACGPVDSLSSESEVARPAQERSANGQTVTLRLLRNEAADYTRYEGYAPAERTVQGATPTERVAQALRELANGPTAAERDKGIAPTHFPSDPSFVESVGVVGSRLIVDFDQRLADSGALAGDGAAVGLVGALLANAFNTGDIESFELRGEGSCETFARWLEIDTCLVRTRAQAEDWQSSTAVAPSMPKPAAPRNEAEPYCGLSQPDCVEPK